MLKTTLGQLIVNEALPEGMRDYGRVLDKKGLSSLLRDLALNHPDRYVDVSKRLADIGRDVATFSGGNSFGLSHISKSPTARKRQKELWDKVRRILDDDNISDQQRHELIIRETGRVLEKIPDEVYEEGLKENNPLALQVLSGSRGNKMNMNELRGTGLLFADHRDNPIPLPIVSSYAEGMKPVEYWAGTYGARKGVMATKFATQDAGFLSKQLNQVSHRLMVVDEDDPREFPHPRGLPVDTDDMDSEGALLAHDAGGYKRNTVLTPKILKHLKSQGVDKILVRSPAVGGSPDGGVYARDVGVREFGRLSGRGEQVGLTAAQALSEPISQGQLSAKHAGGVAGADKSVGGFQYINQLIQVPKSFKGGAAHADLDGTVQAVEPAPAGGTFVTIDGKRHYVGQGYAVRVKKGDVVEAGDPISEGAANPDHAVHHKGVGEGRRIFARTMIDAMKGAGMKVNRRNVELLSRGLINHVRLTDEWNGHLPDEVLPYSTLEHMYEPREDAVTGHPKKLLGQYLERPVLHYTIGTKIRPSVLKELEHFGVQEIVAHPEPPPFAAEMIRGMYSLQHDPDWMTRMYGSGLKGSLLDAAHTGAVSDELGTSFVPGLARAVEFGRVGTVRQPEPGKPLPPAGVPLPENDMARKKKPTDKPTSPIALDVQPPKPPPSFTSRLGSLFKGSVDQVAQLREAQALIEKQAQEPTTTPHPQRQQTPTPQPTTPPPAPQPQRQPTPQPQRQPTPQPQQSGGWLGAMAPAWDQFRQGASHFGQAVGEAYQSAVNPGQVHPSRMQGGDPWARSRATPGNGLSAFYGYGRNPYAFASGGYRPGMGPWHTGQWSPEQMSAFVAGGVQNMGGVQGTAHADHLATDPSNFLGSAVRYGSLFDSNAVAALTGQSPYVRGLYNYEDPERPRPQGAGRGQGRGGFAPGGFGDDFDEFGGGGDHAQLQQALQGAPQEPNAFMAWLQEQPRWVQLGVGTAAEVGPRILLEAGIREAVIQQVRRNGVEALGRFAPQAGQQLAGAVTRQVAGQAERQVAGGVARQLAGQAERQVAGQAMRRAEAAAAVQAAERLGMRGLGGAAARGSGMLWATPVNALLEGVEHTVGLPEWMGGHGFGNPSEFRGRDYQRGTSIDGTVFGMRDPTGDVQALSTLGAIYNAWSRPVASTTEILSEGGSMIGDAVRGLGYLTGASDAPPQFSSGVFRLGQNLSDASDLSTRAAWAVGQSENMPVGLSGLRRPYINTRNDTRPVVNRTFNRAHINPYNWIDFTADNLYELQTLRGQGIAMDQWMRAEDQVRQQQLGQRLEQMRPIRQRWIDAGRPAQGWTDPVSGQTFTNGNNNDFESWERENASTYMQRRWAGMNNWSDRYWDDLSSQPAPSVGEVLSGEAYIRGTETQLRDIPGAIPIPWTGRELPSVNPFQWYSQFRRTFLD